MLKLEDYGRALQYTINAPQVTAEAFDSEFVVLNLETGHYFSLANGAALIWKGLMEGFTPDQLASEIEINSSSHHALDGFVKKLIDAGLVHQTSISLSTEENGLFSEIAAASGIFELEAFDDLAALLVADPIHDVEKEAGWPHRGS